MPTSRTQKSIESGLKTDWNYYFSDIKRRSWVSCLIAISLFILFHEPINDLLNKILVQPIFKACESDLPTDIVVISFFVWAIIFCIRQYSKHLKLSIGSFVVMVTVVGIYIIFFRCNAFYDFYHLSFWHQVAYWDVVLPGLLLLTANYRSYRQPMKAQKASKLSLIEDSPLAKTDDDIYEREAYAKHIAKHILATVPQDAFAISVIGGWGSGKSQFLIRLENILSQDIDTILIKFNPWRAGKSGAIIEEFFKAFSDELNPFSRSVTQKIRQYSQKILHAGEDVQSRLLNKLIEEWLFQQLFCLCKNH